MATLIKSITITTDDGFKSNFGGGSYFTNFINLGYFDAGDQRIGVFRFQDIGIPNGATINSAKLTLYGPGLTISGANYNLRIRGVDEDNTASFSSDPTARPTTTAFGDWDFTDWAFNTFKDTSDFTSVIQEIVDRPGWSSGNALGIFIYSRLTGTTGTFSVKDYSDNPSLDAVLTIDYVGSITQTKTISAKASINRHSVYVSAKAYINNPNASSYGWKVSKPGYSVFTTNPQELIFSSAFSYLKIKAQGTIDLDFADTEDEATAQVAHGLSYSPAYLSFMNTNQDDKIIPDGGATLWSDIDNCRLEAWVDDTYLYLKGIRGTTSGTESKTVTYFLFADGA